MKVQSPAPPIQPAGSAVLGLDWVSSSKGWAYCSLGADSGRILRLGCLACDEIPISPLVRESTRIVVDAPIGLLDVPDRVCADRPCDIGARRWLGALRSSVFVPPVEAELREWQSRSRAGEGQLQGHARGLLPAISAAEKLRNANPRTLESHPELVFSALAGRPLPRQGRKTLLLGLLARIGLLRKAGVALDLSHFLDVDQVPTDNYLDAIAMALVARAWARLGEDLLVIRRPDGAPERLGSDGSTTCLMALPDAGPRTLEESPMTSDELLALASRF